MSTDARRAADRARHQGDHRSPPRCVVDGSGRTEVSTGLPFFDHMVDQLGRHASFDLTVHAQGDLHVDAHHTVEDVGIVLGELPGGGAGRQGRRAPLRLHAGAAGRGADRGRAGPVGPAVSSRTGSTSRPDTPGLGTPPFNPQLAEEFWRAFVTAAERDTSHPLPRGQEHAPHARGQSSRESPAACATPCGSREVAFPRRRGACDGPTYRRPRLWHRQSAVGREGAAARRVRRAARRPTPRPSRRPTAWCCPGWGRSGLRGALRESGLEQPARAAARGRRALSSGCAWVSSCSTSDSVESPGAAGLGVFPGTVGALPPAVKHPQMQWNTLEVCGEETPMALEGLGQRPWVYFVHSFAPPVGDETVAMCDYGGSVAAAGGAGHAVGRAVPPREVGARPGWRCWPISCAWHRRGDAS